MKRGWIAGLLSAALLCGLLAGCEPEVETIVTGLTLDLRPCVTGQPLDGPDGGAPAGGASTCGATLDRAVATGTINACLTVRPLDGQAVKRLPMHWQAGELTTPLGGDLGLAPGQRFEAGLFFLAESDETGRICDAYGPQSDCAGDARCVLRLRHREAVMSEDEPTVLDFTGPDGMCLTQNGPPFAPDGPGERCDGVDNDCDRRIDEGYALGDACEVGVGACFAVGQTVCDEAGTGVTCGATPNPLSSERCEDGEGIDDDCDGMIDEGLPCFPCADDAACVGHPIGEQCVAGRCALCDPLDPAFPGCGDDALCCQSGGDIVCLDGTLDLCTACQGGGCDPAAADGCLGRACACGAGAACVDPTPFCVGATCVQCREALGHADCGPDALCCNGTCLPTGRGPGQSCIDCNRGCDQLATDRCDDRECLCGSELACQAPSPVCDPSAPGSCVECIANAQCAGAAGRPVCDVGRRICVPCLADGQCADPRPECVDAACVECDAGDEGAGYRCEEGGDAPICDGGRCRACAAHADCADRPGDRDYCVEGRCRPCDPEGDRGCVDPAAPICDPVEATCRGCADAGECNQNLPPAAAVLQCAPDGRCVGCVPLAGDGTPNLGCRPDDSRPVCDVDDEQCRPCAADAECPAQPPLADGVADGVPFEALSLCVAGRCRECRSATGDAAQDGCQPGGPTPFCADGTCVPCESDGQCGAIDGADPICVGGECRQCDPSDDSGCDDLNFPVCDGETFTCRPCADSGECAAGLGGLPALCVDGVCTGCDPESNAGCLNNGGTPVCADDDGDGLAACRACLDDDECAAAAAGGPDPDRVECVEGRCQGCDPADNTGCDVDGPLPYCGRDPNGGFRCRACARDGECGLVDPESPQCVAGSCRLCDPVGDGAADDVGCAAPTAVCDPGTFTCRGCDQDGECPAGLLCRPDGTCAACVPGDSRGCDARGAAPVCDADRAVCRGCAEDAECAGNPAGDLCVDGACRPCDPGDHRGCGLDALCCGGADPSCVPTTTESCAACGVGCGGSNRCADRICQCGDGPACGGLAPFCEGEAPDGVCVSCFTDDDCSVPGYEQCVLGVCAACDPRLGEGAAGCAPDLGRPYCEPEISACLSCEGDDGRCVEHAGRPECVGDSCFECDPDDRTSPTGQVGCDTAGGTPYCDPAANTCVGCGDDDDRCVDPTRGECVGDGCFACDPRVLQGYAGCDSTTGAPFCDPETSTCRACTADRECDESPGGGQCVGDFCRVCDPADHQGCGDDSLCCDDGIPGCRATDFAVECEVCGVPCDPTTADNCTDRVCQCGADAACADGTPFCVGGGCVECVADDDCGDGTICVGNACVQCDPADDRGCIADGVAPVCGDDFTCRSCGDNAECDANGNGTICLPDGTCRVCDPADHDGCVDDALCCLAGDDPACQPTAPGAQCEACGVACDPATADTCTDRGCACGDAPACADETPLCFGGGCVECIEDGDCGDGTICVGNACVQCDPADDRGCVADGAEPVCGDDSTCRACGDNAECDANGNGAICLGDGTCRACDPVDHDGCVDDALCCLDGNDPACQPTGPDDQCEACGVACDPRSADTCAGRGCACGDGAACADETPYCADGACVECEADGDCGDGTICVGNACVQCDPVDDRGCVADGIAPVCGDDSTCRACADNAECDANGNGTICLLDGTCRACDPADHDGCADDALCCLDGDDPACQPTAPDGQCEACGVACPDRAADTCTGRGCACGAGPVCADDTPYCADGGCVECEADGDCGEGTICVGNACVQCDPADNRGCSTDGFTPVCGDDFTCGGCADNGDCGGNPNGGTCLPSGECRLCDVADHDGCGAEALCCVVGGAPRCQDTAVEGACEACEDGECSPDSADACEGRRCVCGETGAACAGDTPFCDVGGCVECRADGDCGEGIICVDNACVACDPADDRNCDPASGAPVCGDDFACRACGGNAECAANPNGAVCQPLSGLCRVCDPLDHDGCGDDGLCCDAGGDFACQAADPAVQCEACGQACDGDAADTCVGRDCGCGGGPTCAGDQPYCVAGACVDCRVDGECDGGRVCVDNACVECRVNADCEGANPLCDGTGTCVACLDDVDCAEGGEVCVAGACAGCDPADDRGCDADGAAPVCGDDFVCRGCGADGECAANANGATCLPSGECRGCDPADNRGCDAASDAPVCGGDFTCGGCAGAPDCAGNPNGAVCLASGACRACDVVDHTGCTPNQLCCEANGVPTCQGTGSGGTSQCEACGQACTGSNRCTNRVCQCGVNPPCQGSACFGGICL